MTACWHDQIKGSTFVQEVLNEVQASPNELWSSSSHIKLKLNVPRLRAIMSSCGAERL